MHHLIRQWWVAKKSLCFHSGSGHYVFGLLGNGGAAYFCKPSWRSTRMPRGLMALALALCAAPGHRHCLHTCWGYTLCPTPTPQRVVAQTAAHRKQPLCPSGSCLWDLGLDVL